MDKGRLHRQFARPLSKLFETAIFGGNTLAVSFLFCWLFSEARWPAPNSRHFAKKEAALLDAA